MAMEEVLDGVRRIVHKWVNTVTRLTANAAVGDTQLTVRSTRRFQIGDEVMLHDATIYETGLSVVQVIDDTTIVLASPILNNWTVGQNSVLQKTINEQFIQGIYIGDPDVIPMYPAITINGISRASEWMTIESTKERYELEISVFVREATHEAGYRFLMALTDTIQLGLKRNIWPLAYDYDVLSLSENIVAGDHNIRLNNRDQLYGWRRIIIEDETESQENWIDRIYTEDTVSVHLVDAVCSSFSTANTSIVVPHRFLYNSWPADIDYGKIHKGELLRASVIHWFAEEEESQFLRRTEQQLY